ncbi:alpha-hydroxy acid oxidase [Arthrobacter sunyaminii]|uniref:alpha-hydroxy acid oxidase n=1 Tax=Arthrobacter sunyaminii TaxID=2816859 RepID=UPI001A94A6B7|nr:alpha-hydroxy acid oxidase [Arthrobacter sunyaminii]MBO0896144.1 alpha-hydroxy-acid oxidizing protein [Arthrobacter sunyaminii]
MKRRIPQYKELRDLVQFKPFDLDRRRARLAKATNVWELRDIAKRRIPAAAFDYVDGGSFGEHALNRNRAAFDDVEFVPHVLRDVTSVDLRTKIAGTESALPVGIGPTGLTRLMHTEGEIGGARAAAAFGIPFSLSTMGTASIEELAAEVPDAAKWFQLYLWKDRGRSRELVNRAAAAGYGALIVTVDTPVAGARLRDTRNGMTMPPTLTPKTVLDASYRPEWWFNFLTTKPLGFANFEGERVSLAETVNTMFEPSLNFEDLGWLRETWPGKLIVKGIQSPQDAVESFARGADAIVVSNHGGRQLDRAPVPLRILPDIRAAVGPDAEIILDSGIMSGGDIVAAIAAGADFTLIGRAYLYGLMAGGRQGAERTLELLRTEMTVVMQLLGVTSLAELTPEHVRRV